MDAGFSLLEVLAALFVFTLLTLGLVPLLTSSIRGSDRARADTIGKNATLKAMERVRGLPYHISYATSARAVDVLDLYYPNATGDIVDAGRTLFRTVCTPTDLSNAACPRDIPVDHTITFDAQFVDPVATGTQPDPGETATSYQNVAPAATYQWDSLSADTPPRQILQMTITTTWTVGDEDQSYTISSLISDRSFGGRKIKATANVSYGADVYTAYDSRSGGGSNLSTGNVFIMTSESDIEGRRLSTARQTTTALRGELQRDTGGSLATVAAATTNTLQAPPDQEPGTITAGAGFLRHPDFANAIVAQFGESRVESPVALATGAEPSAYGFGEIEFDAGTGETVAIKNPQLGAQDYNELILASAGSPSLVTFERLNGLPAGLLEASQVTTGLEAVGYSLTTTGPDDVTSEAMTGFDRMLMFKTTFIPNSAPILEGGTLSAEGAVIVIDDFQAVAVCDSDSDGGGEGEAHYSGTLYYWEDPAANGSRADGRYRRIDFDITSDSTGTDPLAPILLENFSAGQGNGPLVYDHASANQRIYLFGKTLGRNLGGGGASRQTVAYLRTWNSLTATSHRIDESTDPTGENVSTVNSSVEGAIEIETADLDADRRDVGSMTVSLGSLSCLAEDTR